MTKASRTVDQVTLPNYEEMELVWHDERAKTYKALWQGRAVVLKKCDVWNDSSVAKELMSEASLAVVADGMEMVLVTKCVGKDIGQDLLDDSAVVKIQEAMAAIHEMGALYGDIRPENIIMQNHGLNAKFYFLDFGFLHFTVDKAELLEETETLNSLLRAMSSAC
ncbi:hypothetical protein DFQ26_002897 [Actinomortierella ambigua]|nr:hypothetical protein DFQ26_002897 [Actinomortierella ambigua]